MPTSIGIFTQMRPPVAAVDGNSPLRGKNAERVFKFASGMRDPTGFKVTKEQVISNYTDDGKLADTRWNHRHHVSPAAFNDQNHIYHKVSVEAVTDSTLDLLRQRFQADRTH